MAKIIRDLSALFLLAAAGAGAALHEPFPQGYAMGNLGTIITPDGPGGRLPLYPAVFLGDSLTVGVAASVTTYYDDMDNFGDRHLATVAGGGWLVFRRFGFKTGISHFDALGAYREQSGYISCAALLFRGIRIGAELLGTRLLLASSDNEAKTLGEAGFSLLAPMKILICAVSIDHLPVKPTRTDGADPPLHLRCGIHTIAHSFGAQGVRIDITPHYEHPVSIAIGQEFRFSRYIALHGAIANNPLFIAVGVAVFWGSGCASAALVNHPVLGWSRGFGAEYGWNPSRHEKTAGN
ncbi:MAG: hypothetical protein JW913_05440 [Chitinispirillaceae bacterium]|nr:hypothetical protein [Chitinispirillaceae bacterium]